MNQTLHSALLELVPLGNTEPHPDTVTPDQPSPVKVNLDLRIEENDRLLLENCPYLPPGHPVPAGCRQMRELLDRQLQTCNLALDAIGQGILIVDCQQPHYPIVYINRGFEQLTGYAAAEVLGQGGMTLDALVVDRSASAGLQQAILEQRRCAIETRTHRKDGSTYWSEVTLTPVHDAAGRLTHYVCVSADVTQRHTLEEQLRRSQKMDAIGQLASGVAHEFNNVLALILGYSDNLLNFARLEDEARESVVEIHTASHRAATLTRQLLAFSRNEAPELQSVNLHGVVTGIQKMLQRVVGEDIVFQMRLEAAVWPVNTDQVRMQQAIMNLAINARDAMPSGGTLEVRLFNLELPEGDDRLLPEMPPGYYVGLSVRDTGTGIDADQLPRVFEPFYTTKEPGKGTGLGLPFIYGVIKQSNGHLTVESVPGCGSTFTIYLPATLGPQNYRDSGMRRKCIPEGSETILLVEDEQGLREFFARTLQTAGYQVHAAQNGSEALAIVESIPSAIDLVVTDIVMPQMNGCSLLVKLHELHPQLPAIFMSGYADEALARHGISSEEVPILKKPFLPAELLARVRETLDSKAPIAMEAGCC